MTFRPGASGNPSGRPKKLLKRVDEVLSAAGVHPVEQVLDLLRTAQLSPLQQINIWLELLPYVAPRMKEAPEEPAGDDLSSLPSQELLKRLDAARKKLAKEARAAKAAARKAG